MQKMRILLVLLVTCVALCQSFDPYSRGTHVTTRSSLSWLLTIGLTQKLDIWTPTEAGTYPLVYLLDSFGGLLPGDAYDETMDQIASHGFVVVNAWRVFGALSYENKVTQFTNTVEWSKKHLEKEIHNAGASTELYIDFSLTFGMAHSAGSHVLVEYLKGGCNDFKGMILSSPVDGPESQGFAITDGEVLGFVMPTIVLPAGLDNKAGFYFGFPCAPEDVSNLHFYDALNPSSPRWLVNATEFGHGDYLDQEYLDMLISFHFCAYNHDATLADFENYRHFFSGQVVSFLKSLLEDDCETYLPFIQDYSSMPVLASGEYVNPAGGCPRPSCAFA